MRHLYRSLFAFFLAIGCLCLRAEEGALSPEDEDKIAAKEDAAGDETMILRQRTIFTGTVVLDNPDKPSGRGVLGTFVCTDEKVYPLKAASDEIRVKLAAMDRKNVTVTGKLRVNGKYLVAMAIVSTTPPAAPRDKTKRSGL